MAFRYAVLYEMLLVGLCVVIIEFILYKLFTGKFPSTELKHFWQMVASGMISGASLHLILELVGINEKWCRITYK